MADEPAFRVCATPSCGQPAGLRCPTCIKLDLDDTYFCSQVSDTFIRTHLYIKYVSIVYIIMMSSSLHLSLFRNVSKVTGVCTRLFIRGKMVVGFKLYVVYIIYIINKFYSSVQKWELQSMAKLQIYRLSASLSSGV